MKIFYSLIKWFFRYIKNNNKLFFCIIIFVSILSFNSRIKFNIGTCEYLHLVNFCGITVNKKLEQNEFYYLVQKLGCSKNSKWIDISPNSFNKNIYNGCFRTLGWDIVNNYNSKFFSESETKQNIKELMVVLAKENSDEIEVFYLQYLEKCSNKLDNKYK